MRRTLVAAILSLAAYQAYATSQINLSNYNTNATETLNVGPVANISLHAKYGPGNFREVSCSFYKQSSTWISSVSFSVPVGEELTVYLPPGEVDDGGGNRWDNAALVTTVTDSPASTSGAQQLTIAEHEDFREFSGETDVYNYTTVVVTYADGYTAPEQQPDAVIGTAYHPYNETYTIFESATFKPTAAGQAAWFSGEMTDESGGGGACLYNASFIAVQ